MQAFESSAEGESGMGFRKPWRARGPELGYKEENLRGAHYISSLTLKSKTSRGAFGTFFGQDNHNLLLVRHVFWVALKTRQLETLNTISTISTRGRNHLSFGARILVAIIDKVIMADSVVSQGFSLLGWTFLPAVCDRNVTQLLTVD